PDSVPGGNYRGGGGPGIHRLLPDSRRKWLRVAVGERVNHAVTGRADLDALAYRFGLGNRDAVRREPADDRNIATNAGDGGAKAGKPSGGQQQTRGLIKYSPHS